MEAVSSLNRHYFNELAASYDTKHEKALNQVITEIQARKDFIKASWVDEGPKGIDRSVRLLDYACGPGTVSRALGPYVTQCVGIDLSENMVAAYNARARSQGLFPEKMFAHQGNLTVADDDTPAAFAGPEFSNFDLAAVGLGFHHFDNPQLGAERLVARLKPGGVLLIIDFLLHDGRLEASHPASHTITHHGFSEEEIRKIFVGAGAGGDFGFETAGGVVFEREGGMVERTLFMARGTKA